MYKKFKTKEVGDSQLNEFNEFVAKKRKEGTKITMVCYNWHGDIIYTEN
jgi:hypothetical protein